MNDKLKQAACSLQQFIAEESVQEQSDADVTTVARPLKVISIFWGRLRTWLLSIPDF